MVTFRRSFCFLLPFLLLLSACTPPSGLTTVLLAVQVAIEAAGPIMALYTGPEAVKILAYVNAALGAVETSASVLSRGPVTQAGADEIAGAWSKAVLDSAILNGASPDVVAIITAISNASKAFVHQFTQGRQAVSLASRAPMASGASFTFSRSDRRALADIQKRAVALKK